MQFIKKNLLFILLLLIYIGLGLPDSLLSTTWPSLSKDLNMNLEFISVLSLIAISFTMISSFFTSQLNLKFGVHTVVIGSMCCCLSGIIIFSIMKSPTALIIAEIIMGIGAGAIDSNVNYIASKNLKIGQLNLLHGFWGVGVTFTPLIATIVYQLGFSSFVVFYIIGIIFVLLITYSLLHINLLKIEYTPEETSKSNQKLNLVDYFGVLIYFLYGVEFVIGIFLASYLTAVIDASSADAAFAVSCYWGGLLVSRLVAPLLFKQIKPTLIIKIYCIVMLIDLLLINMSNIYTLMVGFAILGFCFGPIFPTFMHFTERIHDQQTSFFISKQISAMYLAIFIFQILIGYVASITSLIVFKYYITFNIILLAIFIFLYLSYYHNSYLD